MTSQLINLRFIFEHVKVDQAWQSEISARLNVLRVKGWSEQNFILLINLHPTVKMQSPVSWIS